MKDFNQKVAAITGAGSGIGRQLALALAQQGCHLALSDINAQTLAETAQHAESYGVKVTQQVLDVSQREQVEAWADQTQQLHGKVNLIFNNAGVALGSTVEGMSYDDLEWIMGINFWGVVYGTKSFLPHLKASGEGHVVNISSLFGIIAQPSQSGYNASKFAVRGFTESLRQELLIQKCGVSATCVHPGGIRTNIAKSARMHDNLQHIGIDAKKSIIAFEKLLRIPPETAAQVILNAVKQDKARVLVGNDAKLLDMMQRIIPMRYHTLSHQASVKMFKFL